MRVDALCTLGDGTKANIEVQRSNNTDHLRRIRYNSSCITASEMEPGEKFENVPTVIVVYISEFDFLNEGRTIYHIENVIQETGTMVDNEKFPVFSNRMKYLKHSEGGSSAMCRVMEEYTQEIINEQIKNALNEGIEPEKIVRIFKVSLEHVLEIRSNQSENSMA